MRFGAGGVAGSAALSAAVIAAAPVACSGQSPSSRAGSPSDTGIVVSDVQFKSGADQVPAILARPAKKGQYPVVLIIHANSLREPYIQEAAELVAREGFVALAVDLFHFLPRVSWEEFQRMSRDSIGARIKAEFREERMVRDLQSGIDYAQRLPFTKAGGVGLVGFCGGGWNALLFAAQSKDVSVVAAFYAPVAMPDSTRRTVMDVVQYIGVPVQFHQAANDPAVPTQDVTWFVAALKSWGTQIQRYTYPSTAHGFMATNRPVYDTASADLAWQRVLPFLRAKTGEPVKQRPLAPPFQRQRSSGSQGGSSGLSEHPPEHGGY